MNSDEEYNKTDDGKTDYDKTELISRALQMRKMAYAPYSHFYVGAALLAEDGRIFTGCNIENASYPAGICAERTAVFKAVSAGVYSFRALAVAGGEAGAAQLEFCPPCGICRQVLREFCPDQFPVLLARSEYEYQEITLGELLPLSFGPDHLKGEH